jgi:hypothetical protein
MLDRQYPPAVPWIAMNDWWLGDVAAAIFLLIVFGAPLFVTMKEIQWARERRDRVRKRERELR